MADAALQVGQHAEEVAAFGMEGVAEGQDRLAVAGGDGLAEVLDLLGGSQPVDRQHVGLGDLLARERNDLVEDGLRVAHPAVGEAGDGRKRVLVGRDAVGLDDARQLGGDDLFRDRVELQALAARRDRRQHLVGFGRREDELHPGRRLFERLQERIEGFLGELVDFIDDEDLVGTVGRGELALLANLLGVLELTVGGGVDLDDVEAAAGFDREANRVVQGEIGLRATRTIQGLGQDAGRGRLARATRPDEQVGVGQLLARQGVPQRPHDVLLPDELVEAAGAPAARDDLESGFSHEPARKRCAAKVSTGQTSAYSHSMVAGGLEETS